MMSLIGKAVVCVAIGAAAESATSVAALRPFQAGRDSTTYQPEECAVCHTLQTRWAWVGCTQERGPCLLKRSGVCAVCLGEDDMTVSRFLQNGCPICKGPLSRRRVDFLCTARARATQAEALVIQEAQARAIQARQAEDLVTNLRIDCLSGALSAERAAFRLRYWWRRWILGGGLRSCFLYVT